MKSEDVIGGGENGGEVVRKGAGPVENDVTDHEIQSVRLQPIRDRKEGLHWFKGRQGWGGRMIEGTWNKGLAKGRVF